jgi:hypothetical protein
MELQVDYHDHTILLLHPIKSQFISFASTLWHPYSYKERRRLFLNMPVRHWWEEEVWLCPYSTSTLEGGGWPAPHPDRFTPKKETRCPLYRRLSGLWDRAGRIRKISPPMGFESRTVQPVARRYTDWAISLVPMSEYITNLPLVNLRSPKLPLA